MLCRKCSKEIPDEALYCCFCGSAVSAVNKPRHRRGNYEGYLYKRGSTWTVRVCVGHKTDGDRLLPIWRTKGGFRRKQDAAAAAPALAAAPTQKEPRITLSALYDQWKEKYSSRVTHSTMLCYSSAFNWFKPLHHLQFLKIKVSDWQSCIDNCPKGKRTKENMKAFCSLLYKYAMQLEIVSSNKSESLYTGSDPKTTREAITPAELERIKASPDPYAPYVVALCYLGFRPGELLALKKSSFDPERMVLIGGGKTKAGTDRPIPISPKIAQILLDRYAAPGEYLFPRLDEKHAGQKMSDSWFREKAFDPLMKSLGITGKVPYSCRHTFANLLKNVRGSDTDKAALMGHTQISMTEYYQEADYDSLRAIIEAI